MADANLLKILSSVDKLDNMVVYGNVRCAIAKPTYLSDKVALTDGFFALVDVLALKCNGIDYFSNDANYSDSKHIYFSKGSIVVVLDDKSVIGKNVKVFGRTLKGCSIKKQRTRSPRDGIVAFSWTKVGGAWCISPNKVQIFGDSDVRGTVLEEYVVNLVNGVPFKRPASVDSIMEYDGVSEVNPLVLSEVVGGFDYSTERVDLSSIPMNLVHRLDSTEISEFTQIVGEDVKELLKKVKEYSKNLITVIKDGSNEDKSDMLEIEIDIVNRFIRGIASKYNLPLSRETKVKGKEFVDDFLDNISISSFRETSQENDSSSKMSKEVFKVIEKVRMTVPLDETILSPEKSGIPVLQSYEKYSAMVIGEITGVGVSEIISNYNSISRYNNLNISEWIWCLIRNPYLCGMLGSGLNIWDCDRICLGFSQIEDMQWCLEIRNMLVVLDRIKNVSSRSTLIKKSDILGTDTYSALGRRYKDNYGYPFSQGCLEAIKIFRDNSIPYMSEVYSESADVNKTLSNLLEIGLVEEVNGDIILTSDLNKEYKIYSTLIEKGNADTGITPDEVLKTIDEFEEKAGFKLEVLQRDGIQLITKKAGVLSGCAGSGKTTTSDCMVMGIQNYLPEYELRFGAPTGKAARRLAEVVGSGVKTIHSMFGLGLSGEPYLYTGGKYIHKNEENAIYAYFLDEMAMCNTNLMYEIVNHLNDEDLIYFLGDIRQLPPIGKGSPFKSLMSFLPCVELGVSKRSAANGNINYNCGLVNFVSDDTLVELQSGDDFITMPCADAEIPNNVLRLFSEFLKTYKEDDIQVITGYQTDRYLWSTTNLNPLLQKMLRRNDDICYVYNNQTFMKNDRVIHVKRNAYDMPRFRRLSDNSFEEVVTFGVVNGELGKIIGCVRSDICTINKWEDRTYTKDELDELSAGYSELLEKRRKTNVDIRDESVVKDEKVYFIVVSVYDVDLQEDVVVLYRANYNENLSNEFYAKTFTGGDLRYLDLAYALTTHKMQGSQNPAIIIPLGSTGSASFINRNMLNTMITRASSVVGLIGSVKGRNSALTNGRRVTNIDDCSDVLSLLIEY